MTLDAPKITATFEGKSKEKNGRIHVTSKYLKRWKMPEMLEQDHPRNTPIHVVYQSTKVKEGPFLCVADILSFVDLHASLLVTTHERDNSVKRNR